MPRREPPLPNVGQDKARAAAKVVGGIVLMPSFATTDNGTDWNDYAAQHGKAALRAQVEAALRPHGIGLPTQSTARPVITQADRDAARQRTTAFPNGKQSAADRAMTDTARRTQTLRPQGPGL